MVALLTAAVAVAPRVLHHPNAPARLHVFADPVFGGWLRWDGWWYVMIARNGYTYRPHHMSAVAFFPAYPLLVRAVSAVLVGGVALSAIAVTMLCGGMALVLFHRWCSSRMNPLAARSAVIALAVYPFAWYLFGAAYSDAMYLALVLAAFLLLEQDHLLAAGLIGALATATRPTGITLVIGLVAVALQCRQRAVTTRDLTLLVSIGGLLAWCGWLALRFGNPFAFIETEGAPGWDQPPGFHTWLKLGFVHHLTHLPGPEAVALVVHLALTAIFLSLVPTVARRFGAGYAVYTAVTVLVPAVSSGDFLGLGRYLLPAFPVFAVLGELSSSLPDRLRLALIAGSTTLLVAGAALFSAGYLVS